MIRKSIWLFTLCITACAGYQPAYLEENSIENPTLGFNGYLITMPEGFSPVTGDIPNSTSYRHINNAFVKKNYLGKLELEYKENFIFYNAEENIAIGFKVNALTLRRSLHRMNEQSTEVLLSGLNGRLSLSKGGTDTKRIDVSGRPALLSHDRFLDSVKFRTANAQSTCFVLGEVNDFYFIMVEGPPNLRRKVRQYAEETCKNLSL